MNLSQTATMKNQLYYVVRGQVKPLCHAFDLCYSPTLHWAAKKDLSLEVQQSIAPNTNLHVFCKGGKTSPHRTYFLRMTDMLRILRCLRKLITRVGICPSVH